jgi:oligo-1,6-glucosidase/alpha-glucosidase
MKIVLDMVLNHTSDRHPWFLESKRSKDNPKSDWYVWRDGKDGGPPNNWTNIPASGSAWTYVPERVQYYYAAFMPRQPDLNMSNPEVRAEILDMTRFWLDKGVDGFRLDIFDFLFEDERYPDNPFTLRVLPGFEEGKWNFEEHKYNYKQPETVAFAKELRAVLESYEQDKFMVGEVFGSHLSMRELLGEEHDGLNMVFLFDFLESFEFSASYFREKAEEYESFYPRPLVPTYVFSNHDQFRSITRLDNNLEKADILAAYQLTMRGVPFVYQGEEIGMRTGSIPLEDAQDPLAANWMNYPKFIVDRVGFLTNRDNTRTPMQWNDEMNAGFSTNSETWLPVQENYPDINVESSLENENSLLHTYRDILRLRNELQALRHGRIVFIDDLPDDVLGYRRGDGKDRVSIYLNFSDQPRSVQLNEENGSALYSKRAELEGANAELDGYGILMIQ